MLKRYANESDHILTTTPPPIDPNTGEWSQGWMEVDENYQLPEISTEELPDWANYTKHSIQSKLYVLATSKNHQPSLNALNFIFAIANNTTLTNDTATLQPDGLLHQKLQQLVATISDANLPAAIEQFNQILRSTLKVEWQL